MKKLLIPTILCSVLLSGCWDMIEPEKLGMVSAAGFDIADKGQIKLVIQEISEQRQASGGQPGGVAAKVPAKLHEAVAPTISEAVEKINTSNFHRTYFSHANAFILSEELVRSKGLADFLDFFERTPEIRRNTWLLISMKGQFQNIFNTDANYEANNDLGKVIRGITRNKTRSSHIAINTLGDFLNLFWEKGSEPYTSGIGTIESVTGNKAVGTNPAVRQRDIFIENTAAFKNDKLVGWLNDSESTGLLWAVGGIKGGTISILFNGKEIVLQIVQTNSNIRPVIVNGKINMDIHIRAMTNINESRVKVNFKNSSDPIKIENLLAEEIKRKVFAALDKSKQFDSDLFGFGNYIFSKYPGKWKKIESQNIDYFHDIKVNIEVDAILNQAGLIKENAP